MLDERRTARNNSTGKVWDSVNSISRSLGISGLIIEDGDERKRRVPYSRYRSSVADRTRRELRFNKTMYLALNRSRLPSDRRPSSLFHLHRHTKIARYVNEAFDRWRTPLQLRRIFSIKTVPRTLLARTQSYLVARSKIVTPYEVVIGSAFPWYLRRQHMCVDKNQKSRRSCYV